jgi:hypothetical protein
MGKMGKVGKVRKVRKVRKIEISGLTQTAHLNTKSRSRVGSAHPTCRGSA